MVATAGIKYSFIYVLWYATDNIKWKWCIIDFSQAKFNIGWKLTVRYGFPPFLVTATICIQHTVGCPTGTFRRILISASFSSFFFFFFLHLPSSGVEQILCNGLHMIYRHQQCAVFEVS